MTKENDNGQLEWTFEELDLEGALLEVTKEYENAIAIKDYLSPLVDKFIFDNWNAYLVMDKELSKAWKKVHYLQNVQHLIKRLILRGELYNVKN